MAEGALNAVLNRLEGVTARLEAFEGGLVSGGASASARAAGGAAPAAGAATPAGGGGAAALADWDTLIGPALADLKSRASQLGEEVQKCTDVVVKGFTAERDVVEAIGSCQKPDMAGLQPLLTPVAMQLQAAEELTGGRRGSCFNHYKAVAEALPGLSWVAYSPGSGMSLPAAHVEQAWQSAEFYTNKIMMEFRNSEPAHVDWVKSLKALLTALGAFVKKHHVAGPAWNPSGPPLSQFKPGAGGASAPAAVSAPPAAAAPPAARGGPPPPPPPLPPGGPGSLMKDPPASASTAASGNKGPGMSAVLSALNKGEAVTSGLRKVTDDMKTKNRSDRSGAVPAAAVPQAPAPAASGAKAVAAGNKLPRKECEQGRKWVVENFVNDNSIVVSDTNPKQSIYIYNCKNSVVKVEGKVNTILVDSCSKVGLLFDDLLAVCELVNSSSLTVQVTGLVPTVAVDKVSGLQLYLSEASLGADITTAQSCEMNVVVPNLADPEGDPSEMPIPEQFVTRLVKGKLVTEPVHHSAG